jgi:hypothetical protein
MPVTEEVDIAPPLVAGPIIVQHPHNIHEDGEMGTLLLWLRC